MILPTLLPRSARVRVRDRRRARRAPILVETLEGRALMAGLLPGPLSASMAPALVGAISAESAPATTPATLSIRLSVQIDPANVRVGDLLRGIRDLFQDIQALVNAPTPTDPLRQAVEDALARVADATGAPQALPVIELTETVAEVAETATLTAQQQSQIASSVATILDQAGLDDLILTPTTAADRLVTPGPTAPLPFDPTRLTGPYAEALVPAEPTRGQSTPGLENGARLSPSDPGASAPEADADHPRLIEELADLLQAIQAPTARKVAFLDALSGAARDLPARPDADLVIQLRQTITGLTPPALGAPATRSALARQLQSTLQSAGLPPADAQSLTAQTLDLAATPGLDVPALRALFETVLAIVNGQLPTPTGRP